jgi:DMSO/TMAO reductase YedYZ heme-binding membrane subunit
MGTLVSSARFCAYVYFAAMAYVILRYVVLGPVPASDVPFYLSNKALAVAGTALVAWSLAMGPLIRMGFAFPRPSMPKRKWIGMLGGSMVAVHVGLSLALLGPERHPKFFADAGGLGRSGWLSLALGTAGAILLIGLTVTSLDAVRRRLGRERWKRLHSLGPWVLVLGLGHVASIAWPSWLQPEKWGVTLPVTLIAASVALVTLVIRTAERLGVKLARSGGRLPAHRPARRLPVPPARAVCASGSFDALS